MGCSIPLHHSVSSFLLSSGLSLMASLCRPSACRSAGKCDHSTTMKEKYKKDRGVLTLRLALMKVTPADYNISLFLWRKPWLQHPELVPAVSQTQEPQLSLLLFHSSCTLSSTTANISAHVALTVPTRATAGKKNPNILCHPSYHMFRPVGAPALRPPSSPASTSTFHLTVTCNRPAM